MTAGAAAPGATSEDVAALAAEDWPVRHAAYRRIEEAGPDAIPLLLAGMGHADWRVRAASAGLADHLADDRCGPALARALGDPVAAVRRNAVHALGCQRCKPAPLRLDTVAYLIHSATTDPSIRVRRAAAHQLGCQAADRRAAAALRGILARDTDPKLLRIARWGLGEQGG